MHKNFVTTNIRIPREIWKSLKEKALREGKSLSQLFREGAIYVLGWRKVAKSQFKNDPFYKIIGKGNRKKRDSVEHNKNLYGDKNFC